MTTYKVYDSKHANYENLALFNRPVVESSVDSRQYQCVKPINSVNGMTNDFIEFNIVNPNTSYLALNESYLCLKCRVIRQESGIVKVIKEQGIELTPHPTDDQADDIITIITPDESLVCLTNNFMNSLIRDFQFKLGGVLISGDVGSNHSYKSYLDNILFNSEPINTLSSQLMYFEDGEFLGDIDPFSSGNEGLKERRQIITSSKNFDVRGKLHTDFCLQPKVLLNNIEINIKLLLHQPSFYLLSSVQGVDFRVEIVSASLELCHLKIKAPVMLAIERILKTKTAYYPYVRSAIRTFTYPKETRQITIHDPFSTFIPFDLTCVFLSASGFSGSMSLNPFYFHHRNCSFFATFVNNQPCPFRPYEPMFVNDKPWFSNYTDAYLGLLGSKPDQVKVSKRNFGEGYSIFRSEIEQVRVGSFPQAKRGDLRIEIRLDSDLVEQTVVLLYGKFCGLVEIDSDRVVRTKN